MKEIKIKSNLSEKDLPDKLKSFQDKLISGNYVKLKDEPIKSLEGDDGDYTILVEVSKVDNDLIPILQEVGKPETGTKFFDESDGTKKDATGDEKPDPNIKDKPKSESDPEDKPKTEKPESNSDPKDKPKEVKITVRYEKDGVQHNEVIDNSQLQDRLVQLTTDGNLIISVRQNPEVIEDKSENKTDVKLFSYQTDKLIFNIDKSNLNNMENLQTLLFDSKELDAEKDASTLLFDNNELEVKDPKTLLFDDSELEEHKDENKDPEPEEKPEEHKDENKDPKPEEHKDENKDPEPKEDPKPDENKDPEPKEDPEPEEKPEEHKDENKDPEPASDPKPEAKVEEHDSYESPVEMMKKINETDEDSLINHCRHENKKYMN